MTPRRWTGCNLASTLHLSTHAVKSIFALFRKQRSITELLWVLTHATLGFSVVSYLVQIVDRFSSTIGNPIEIVSDMQSDHRNMTKFSQPDEPGFLSICSTLDHWMKELGREWPYLFVAFFLSGCYIHEGTRDLEG